MIRNGKRKIALTAVAGASVLALGLTACGTGGSGDDGNADGDRALRVWAGSQTPITANYNPFAPTVLHGALGPIYEPLFFFNKTSDSEPVGLIGDSYEYNEDGTVITITIKPDLKWSDGEPLTAADVAFSFNYEANNPEGNGLVSAEATDDTTVVLTYAAAQYTTEFQRLGSTYILPEHIWADVADFANFANEEPVGSGAYVVDKTTSESYTLVANENFRDADKLGVKKVQYIAVDNNQTAQDLLAAGELDWTGMFIPNPDDVTANGKISWVNTPQDPTVLYTCSNAELGCAGPQTDVAVRQALNVAIDRAAIKDKAFVGLTGDISPTYALLPRDEKWVADAANEVSPQEADAAEAGKILEAMRLRQGRRLLREGRRAARAHAHLGRRLDRLQRRRQADRRAGRGSGHQDHRVDRAVAGVLGLPSGRRVPAHRRRHDRHLGGRPVPDLPRLGRWHRDPVDQPRRHRGSRRTLELQPLRQPRRRRRDPVGDQHERRGREEGAVRHDPDRDRP